MTPCFESCIGYSNDEEKQAGGHRHCLSCRNVLNGNVRYGNEVNEKIDYCKLCFREILEDNIPILKEAYENCEGRTH